MNCFMRLSEFVVLLRKKWFITSYPILRALKIDESRYLYDVEEGKVFLSSEIGKFKKAIQIEGND